MAFDADFYRAYYPDATTIRNERLLYLHYLRRRRDRSPNPEALIADLQGREGPLPADFDPITYIALHPDLRAVYGQPWQGQDHFLRYGRIEGRTYPSSLRAHAHLVAHKGAGRIRLVLEGFDGSGKSTLAAAVAAAVGGRVVRPFGGSLGEMMLWLARTNQPDLLDRLAREAVVKGIDEAPAGVPLIFDRHWVTACSLLPEANHADWQPRPDTVICWADLATTQARLRTRGDVAGAAMVEAGHVEHFRALATDRGLPLLDTSHLTVAEAAARLITAMTADPGACSS